MRRHCTWAVLVAVSACALRVPEAGEQPWIEVKSAHFTILSSTDEKTTVAAARDLEVFHQVVSRALGAPARPLRPTLTFLFRSKAQFDAFWPRQNAAGLFVSGWRENFAVVNAGRSDDQTRSTFRHEYVHALVDARGFHRFPAWLNEGLAELLETVAVEGDRIEIGKPPPGAERLLLNGEWLSLRTILTMEDPSARGPETTMMFYAQAWALTHYLQVGPPEGRTERQARLARYLVRINAGEAVETAFPAAFETSIEALDDDLKRYTRRRRVDFGRVPASRFPAETQVSVRRVPLDESLLRLAELSARAGNDPRQTAQLCEQSVRHNARNARALVLLAQTKVGEQADEAHRLADAASSLAPSDAHVRADCGWVMLFLAESNKGGPNLAALVAEARAHFSAGIAADRGLADAYVGLARSYATPGSDAAQGLPLLEQAAALRPGDLSLELERGRLYIAAGQDSRARQHLQRIVARTLHAEGLRAEAEKLLAEIEARQR